MQALYRRYRPQKLVDVVGQTQIKKTLSAQLYSGKMNHAYLFTGSRGIGKTTIARVLAKAINCEKSDGKTFADPCNKCDACMSFQEGTSLDLIEIDAASNRGIDDIRDLREKVKLAPSSSRYKVYIIDEVHMLTTEAFNALLKTLEEPPAHVVFILATTEPHKLPATIISRCQRFDFQKPTIEEITELLERISKEEKVKIEKEGLEAIAESAEGAFRDAVTTLDKVLTSISSKDKITQTQIRELLSITEKESITEFLNKVSQKKAKAAIEWLNEYINQGGNPHLVIKASLDALRDVLLENVGVKGKTAPLINIAPKHITKLIRLLITADNEIKTSSIPQLPLEMAIVEYALDDQGLQNEEESNSKNEKDTEKKAKTNKKEEKEILEENNLKEEIKQEEDLQNETQIVNLSLDNIQNKWVDFLEKVKPLNHSLELLLKSCKLHQFDGKYLTLETNYRFHKELLETTKTRRSIESIAHEVFSAAVMMRYIVNEKKNSKKEENLNVVDPDDEMIKISKEIFKAEVVD